jgi:hypothetical protein
MTKPLFEIAFLKEVKFFFRELHNLDQTGIVTCESKIGRMVEQKRTPSRGDKGGGDIRVSEHEERGADT